MNTANQLDRLTRRVCWKRWLPKLQRSGLLLAGLILLFFCADHLVGLNVRSLRTASALTLGVALALLALDWISAWVMPLDRIGLAHLVEKRYPELAERLVTLVQLPTAERSAEFGRMLEKETEQCLAEVDPAEACPLRRERTAWLATTGLLTVLFIGLCFAPGFGRFSARFFTAWALPLSPFEIEVTPANDGYALRGGSSTIEAVVHVLDRYCEPPTECNLVTVDEAGVTTVMPMTGSVDGCFAATLPNLRAPVQAYVQAGDVMSAAFEIRLLDVPALARPATLTTRSPAYLPAQAARTQALDEKIDALQYSQLSIHVTTDRQPSRGILHIKSKENRSVAFVPLHWDGRSATVETVAAKAGAFEAELVFDFDHGLTAAVPVGTWKVHGDTAPRFTQPLRLQGGGPALLASRDYRIAPDDVLKLQTVVEDEEGIEQIWFEYRVNEEAPRLQKWLHAGGRTKFVIDNWLPLPASLKETDRVQFRIHASDNRRLKAGQAATSPRMLPATDLEPHITIAPSNLGTEPAWITLRVDRSVEHFLKQQAQAQADEIRDVIAKIKQKLQTESTQVQELQRNIHRQSALTLEQRKQAESLRKFNAEIAQDLLDAEQRFGGIPELANLAGHFLEIAEIDMMKSHEALERFSEKDRTLPDAEKELQTANDALLEARKKLDRMLDWNKRLARDRLDQFEIDKLLKRQNDLAERLAKLLATDPTDDADLAKQIDAIRAEQSQLAEQTEKLQAQSSDPAETEQQMRVKKLADDALKLAMEQKASLAGASEKLSPEMQARLDKLADAQAHLANRVQPFAKKHDGPDVKPAQLAADALKKPNLGQAIDQQKEHEKRLRDWVSKSLPDGAANSLREQVLALAKKQMDIRADLVKLGEEFARLKAEEQQKRVRDLIARQKELPTAVAKLRIDAKDDRLRPVQKRAEDTTQQAHDQLAGNDALTAFDTMEKAHQELLALAGLLPKLAPIERKDIKDAALREKIEQVDGFAKEQEKLRLDAEKLMADLGKGGPGQGKPSLGDKANKLAAELMELAQKSGPAMKEMAKESAKTVDDAKKAMQASADAKTNGNAGEAKAMADAAEKKLELAAKQLAKLAQDQTKEMKTADAKTAALKESGTQMRKAEDKLPTKPMDAQQAMKAAAKSLAAASQQAGKQSASKLPQPSRNPAANSALGGGSGPRSLPKAMLPEAFQGKAWGELPGELKTQMLQDLRARFGEEYAEVIRDYFDRLAESEADK